MKSFIQIAAFVAALVASMQSFAGPGAHGPNGEHLDGPAPVLSAGGSVPRVEAKSEMFELVARVEGGVLSILVDRFDTNEPVLDAAVEVESGALKSKATFRREQGDYAVSDAELLKLLASPGAHPLLFTVNAGKESDLLDGQMETSGAPGEGAAASHPSKGVLAGAIVAVLLVAGGGGIFSFMRGRKRGVR